MSPKVAFRRWTPLGLALAALLAGPAAAEAPRVNEKARVLKEFSDRVQAYVDLHKKLEGGLPPLKNASDQTEIKAHQDALAKAIQQSRVKAETGDIFIEAVRPIFQSVIAAEFQGPNGSRKHETIHEDMDGAGHAKLRKLVLKANAPYPDGAPVSSVPPSVLLNLPKLPNDVVEYRFVGRDLVLHDGAANLIADVLRRVVP